MWLCTLESSLVVGTSTVFFIAVPRHSVLVSGPCPLHAKIPTDSLNPFVILWIGHCGISTFLAIVH